MPDDVFLKDVAAKEEVTPETEREAMVDACEERDASQVGCCEVVDRSSVRYRVRRSL